MCEHCTHRIAIYETRWTQVNALESVPEFGDLLGFSLRMPGELAPAWLEAVSEAGYLATIIPTNVTLDRWCDQNQRRSLLTFANGKQLPLHLTDNVPVLIAPVPSVLARIKPRRRTPEAKRPSLIERAMGFVRRYFSPKDE